MIEIGVTGTRGGMTEQQFDTFKRIIELNDISFLHHGCCIGVDEQCVMIARSINPKIIIAGYPPINTRYKSIIKSDAEMSPKEYRVRNIDIVNASDIIYGFPKQYSEQPYGGTWQALRQARLQDKANIVWPDGRLETWWL